MRKRGDGYLAGGRGLVELERFVQTCVNLE